MIKVKMCQEKIGIALKVSVLMFLSENEKRICIRKCSDLCENDLIPYPNSIVY